MTPIEQLTELDRIAKAANAKPADTLRKVNDLLEDRVQDRIAAGETELQARTYVLSGKDQIAAKLYKMAEDLSAQMAYQDRIFRD
ncbi:MAG: hypothetical protein R3C08_13020 [Hyphomonas sp.]